MIEMTKTIVVLYVLKHIQDSMCFSQISCCQKYSPLWLLAATLFKTVYLADVNDKLHYI